MAVDVDDEDGACEGLPTCPICLTEIFELRHKAVVVPCMHVFCLPCLKRWSEQKRVCPLCKGRIKGYMYAIESSGKYKERVIPASPWRRHIYDDDLWALPIDPPPGAAAGGATNRQRRLQDWIDRELRAVLQQEDVNIPSPQQSKL
ncbi:hypothetical protein WJX72_010799 [[Myrmecia] bisecta]|uniref:RING-type E3 ubiquitin transferase n=1 Tax=[Myrmecia] bisecta TaxID=41462 RepID=A0AAW1PE35_9CHLO